MGPFLSGKKQGPSVAHKKVPRGPDKPGMPEWARQGGLWGREQVLSPVLCRARRGSAGRPCRGLVFCRILALCGSSGKKGLPCTGSPFLFIKVFCAYIGFCLGARIRRMLRLCSSNVGLKTWRLVLSATKYKLLKLGVGCNTPKTDS